MSSPLGDFLRARRDATSPGSVGVKVGERRRAPGLRRSELADLAGISVEYLVRIEQGRDRNPSPSVVNALSESLGLGVTDHEQLRYLAKITSGVCVGESLPQPRSEVRPEVLRVLELLEPAVAFVGNRLGDVLAYTTAFEIVAREAGLLDEERPNLTRFVFTDPRSRGVFADWERLADEQAADLWRGPSKARSEEFAAELERVAGPAFTERHGQHPMRSRDPLRWVHPSMGELCLSREVMELPVEDAQQVVVLLPADDATARSLDRLRRDVASPLHAVR